MDFDTRDPKDNTASKTAQLRVQIPLQGPSIVVGAPHLPWAVESALDELSLHGPQLILLSGLPFTISRAPPYDL